MVIAIGREIPNRYLEHIELKKTVFQETLKAEWIIYRVWETRVDQLETSRPPDVLESNNFFSSFSKPALLYIIQKGPSYRIFFFRKRL